MEIQHDQHETKGTFFTGESAAKTSEMTYTIQQPSLMVIEHTVVDKSLRGKNIGMQLINKAIDFATQKNLKIKPDCSFVRSVFEKHPTDYDHIIQK